MVELPKAPIYRIMKRAGAERVSEGAVDAMIEYLEDLIEDLTLKAIKAAEKSRRKTIRRDDIEFIIDILRG